MMIFKYWPKKRTNSFFKTFAVIFASLLLYFPFADVFLAQAADAWLAGGWVYRQKVTLLNTDQAENLQNFPVMITKTAADTDFWSHVGGSCADVRFTDSNGFVPLSYQIQTCDEGTDTMIAWVKVPQINASSNTDYIYLYYGKAGAVSAESTGVWNSGYEGVWHLDDTTNPTTPDSTSNVNTGTNTASVTSTAGVIGDAASIPLSDYINVGNAVGKPSQFTISVWVRPDSWGNAGIVFSSDDGISPPQTHWGIFGRDAGNIEIFTSDDGLYDFLDVGDPWDATNFPSSEWNNITVTIDGTHGRYYRNGVQIGGDLAQNPFVQNSGTAYPLYFGINPGDEYLYTYSGGIDEVKLSTVARSSAWVKASYLSETDDFTSFGSEESVVDGVLNYFQISTIDNHTAGTPVEVTITARDYEGDLVTGFTGQGNFSVNAGTVTPTVSGNFIAGSLTTNVSFSSAGSARELTVVESGSLAAGISNTFDIAVGDVHHFDINTISSQIAGEPFSITITPKDSEGNVVTSFAGPVSLSSATGTITPEETDTVPVDGVINQEVTLTGANAAQTIAVGYTGLDDSVSNTFLVTPAAPSGVVFADIGTSYIGVPFDIELSLQDVYGNTITDFEGQADFVALNGGSIDPVVSDNFTAGTLSQNITLSDYTGDQQLYASVSTEWGMFTGTSNTFSLTTPPVASAYDFSGPLSGDVNVASTNFTVTPDDLYTGTITITPDGGGLSTPIELTFSNSDTPQTFTITPTEVGEVTFSGTSSEGLADPTFTTYTVNAVEPSAPDISEVDLVGDTVTVSFTDPVEDGGSPIVEYVVTASPGGLTVTGEASPLVIAGLTPGVAYTFTVAAVNGVGPSSPSSVSDPVVIPTTGTTTTPTASAAVLLQYIQQPNQQHQVEDKIRTKMFSGKILRLGSRGEEVRVLQNFLNSKGFVIASSGAGSVGNETTFFGAKTRTALMRYQQAYAKDILIPAGLTRPTGILASFTIAHIEKMMTQ